jgi:streptogramin lyase
MAFDAVVPVGVDPSGLAIGEGAIWVTNVADQTVSRIDPESAEEVATKSTLGTPTGVAVGVGAVWITNGFGSQTGGSQVVRLDPADDRVERAFASSNVQGIELAYDSIWLADPVEDRIVRVDPVTRTVIDRIDLVAGSAPGVIVAGEGASAGIWVVNELAGTVVWIDPETSAVTTFGVEAPTDVEPTDAAVWVTSSTSDVVTRIDPRTGTTVATLTLDDGIVDAPADVLATAAGVWLTSSAEPFVVLIDPATHEVLERFRVDGIAGALAEDEAGDVWVTVHA